MSVKASLVVKEDSVSVINKSLSFSLKEKVDVVVSLNSSSYTLDISGVDNVSLLVIEGSGTFTVTFVQGASTVDFIATDYYAVTLTPTSAAAMDSITITETGATDVTIHAIAYGKVTS